MSQQRDPLPPPLLVYLHANVSEDRAWCNDLTKQLFVRELKGELRQWHSVLIPSGAPTKTIFQQQLAQATAVLVLLSPNLLQDDLFGSFLTWRGSPPHAKAIPLLPILLQPTLDWQELLGGLQVLPRNEKPLSLWENRQSACYEVAQEILSFLEQHASSLEVKEQQNTAAGSGEQKNPAQLSSEMNTYPEQMPVTPPSVDPIKLVEQLRHYTVRVHIARHGHYGTGFFVAQDYILTCAHIVQKAVEEDLLLICRVSGGSFGRFVAAALFHLLSSEFTEITKGNTNLFGLKCAPLHPLSASCILDPKSASHPSFPGLEASANLEQAQDVVS